MRFRALAFWLAATSLGCTLGNVDTDKANKKVVEATGLVEEGAKLQKQAFEEGTPEDVCRKNLDEASGKFDEAATLAKEASKLKVSEVFAEYLDLKSKQFTKLGESIAIEKKACSPTADRKEIQKERDVLRGEADEYNKKAEKIQADNKDQFKPE
jgi:hypothetical protein